MGQDVLPRRERESEEGEGTPGRSVEVGVGRKKEEEGSETKQEERIGTNLLVVMGVGELVISESAAAERLSSSLLSSRYGLGGLYPGEGRDLFATQF